MCRELRFSVASLTSGLRDIITRAMVVLFGAWAFATHPSGNQITGTFVAGAGVLAADQVGFGGGIEAYLKPYTLHPKP
jgi:hypothetical protein